MEASQPSPSEQASSGVTTGHVLLMFGAGEVLIVYLLLAIESPLNVWANRAAETWGGRIALAGIGWLLISVIMFVVLSIAENRAKRRRRIGAS